MLRDFWINGKFVIPWSDIRALDGLTILGLAMAAEFFIPIDIPGWPITGTHPIEVTCVRHIVDNMRPNTIERTQGNSSLIARVCAVNDVYVPGLCHTLSVYNKHSPICSCQFCNNKSKALSVPEKELLLGSFRIIFQNCDECIKKMETNLGHMI